MHEMPSYMSIIAAFFSVFWFTSLTGFCCATIDLAFAEEDRKGHVLSLIAIAVCVEWIIFYVLCKMTL